MKNMKKNKATETKPKDAPDRGKTTRTGEATTSMSEANENIRKSQDEDGATIGPHPTIDRHR